mgnify:FL=1|tara:strand:- start:645 stop:905 length:261 start_codon:yes stop_codon:yes gene_type:complete
MNGPGLLELVVILFLVWFFLGPQKMTEGAHALGKAYREFRGYTSSINSNIPEKDKVRSSAERLGIDTAGMDQDEIKSAIVEELSNE